MTEQELDEANKELMLAKSSFPTGKATSIRHGTMVAQLKKDPTTIPLLNRDKDIIHMLLGLQGEVGELVDALKKHIIYSQNLDVANVREELGDIEFYLEGLRQAIGLNRDEILEQNILKLRNRYPSGSYSDQQAKDRIDKNGCAES